MPPLLWPDAHDMASPDVCNVLNVMIDPNMGFVLTFGLALPPLDTGDATKDEKARISLTKGVPAKVQARVLLAPEAVENLITALSRGMEIKRRRTLSSEDPEVPHPFAGQAVTAEPAATPDQA